MNFHIFMLFINVINASRLKCVSTLSTTYFPLFFVLLYGWKKSVEKLFDRSLRILSLFARFCLLFIRLQFTIRLNSKLMGSGKKEEKVNHSYSYCLSSFYCVLYMQCYSSIVTAKSLKLNTSWKWKDFVVINAMTLFKEFFSFSRITSVM